MIANFRFPFFSHPREGGTSCIQPSAPGPPPSRGWCCYSGQAVATAKRQPRLRPGNRLRRRAGRQRDRASPSTPTATSSASPACCSPPTVKVIRLLAAGEKRPERLDWRADMKGRVLIPGFIDSARPCHRSGLSAALRTRPVRHAQSLAEAKAQDRRLCRRQSRPQVAASAAAGTRREWGLGRFPDRRRSGRGGRATGRSALSRVSTAMRAVDEQRPL